MRYGLLGLLSALILLHLSLVFRSDNTDLIGSSLLYWSAAILILRQKHSQLVFSSDLTSIVLGTLILIPVLSKSASISGNDIFLRIFPILSIAALALIASGIKNLKQYWQELLILFVFAIPPGLILLFFDPSPLTAQVSAFALWSLGFQVSVQNVLISLPKGSIEVYSGCAGVATMLQLFGVALMYLFLQPTQHYQKLLVPGVAVTIAFLINALRVALMAVLVALGDQKAFEYWHVGNGSFVFSTIAVILFSLACQFLLSTYESRSL
ncbi:MAG: cyanoexosortase A [Plectolyngbya sp. WJT66-NPBG17]|jgi:cyanoexosortase A|nr:cyanoexosortase A [Plectolyngbya sp. WJT66-NPBG17]MBW4527038.1 cyanoexosortase A [Phormidium tanganyikae FI6-MK23]